MSQYYANITLNGPSAGEAAAKLKERGDSAYVSPASKGAVVVFHSDLGAQETLAAELSAQLHCPALLVMVFGQSILLYHLYKDGRQIDAYVSSPHEGLELDGKAPEGDAALLCATFDADRAEQRVRRILATQATPERPYAYAANRHGDLVQALRLPTFAVGAGFDSIELGEMPAGAGFDAAELIRIN